MERVGEMADPLALLRPSPTCDGDVDGWAPTDFEKSGAAEPFDAPVWPAPTLTDRPGDLGPCMLRELRSSCGASGVGATTDMHRGVQVRAGVTDARGRIWTRRFGASTSVVRGGPATAARAQKDTGTREKA